MALAGRRLVTLALLAVFAATPAGAARFTDLLDDEQLCTRDEAVCLRGTLRWEHNPRLLTLRGRLESAPGPGLLTIWLTGTTRLGHRHYAPMEIRLRGNRSEIIDFKMIPDHPDVYEWTIDRVEFAADDPDA
jgi:hypothetical protein